MNASRSTSAVYVTRRNCVATLGLEWLWLTRFARAHGIQILELSARKYAMRATEIVAALERHAAEQAPAEPLSDEEERAAMRRRLGLELVCEGAR